MDRLRNLKAKEKQSDLVLAAFDDMEHADKREFLNKKAEIERAGRKRL